MEIAVLGPEEFSLGFETVGVTKVFASFDEAMTDKDVAILVTNSETFSKLSPRQQERALTCSKPTVVVLSFDLGAEENLRLMIKRALGIDLWRQ